MARRDKENWSEGYKYYESRFRGVSKRPHHHAEQSLWKVVLQAFSHMDVSLHDHNFDWQIIF